MTNYKTAADPKADPRLLRCAHSACCEASDYCSALCPLCSADAAGAVCSYCGERSAMKMNEDETVRAILRLLGRMSDKESETGNTAAAFAINRAWHAVNNQEYLAYSGVP